MLVFNLSRVLYLRGIDKPFAFLLQQGFHRTIANNYANDRSATVKIAHLERLCRALNCTPNDLFEWQPDDAPPLAESHSLKSLARNKPAKPLSQIVKDIPIEKLDRIEAMLNELKDEE